MKDLLKEFEEFVRWWAIRSQAEGWSPEKNKLYFTVAKLWLAMLPLAASTPVR